MCLAVVGLLATGESPAAAAQAPSAQQPQAAQQAPSYKVGTVTIKFVGTANVNEQVVRANMQIREGGEFDEVILDRDIRSLYRTGLFEFIEVKHEPVDAQTFNLVVEVTPKFRVLAADGYGAGPRQDLDNPLGVGGPGLHEWVVRTRTFAQMFGNEGGETGVDDDFAARGFENIGASILGRNMFGPVRWPWPDDTWKGWWCDDPPYHTPVFVLTWIWMWAALVVAVRHWVDIQSSWRAFVLCGAALGVVLATVMVLTRGLDGLFL